MVIAHQRHLDRKLALLQLQLTLHRGGLFNFGRRHVRVWWHCQGIIDSVDGRGIAPSSRSRHRGPDGFRLSYRAAQTRRLTQTRCTRCGGERAEHLRTGVTTGFIAARFGTFHISDGHGLADCAFTGGRHVASSTTALRVTVIIAAAKSTEPSMAKAGVQSTCRAVLI
jgi:hypothetical protein